MASLLEEILNRIEYERLIEEGRDPREILHYKFKDVPSDVIDSVIEIDPTKKKSYSQWLLSKWDKEKKTIIDNLKNGRIAKLFQHYKNHNDLQITHCPSVEEGLRSFVPQEDTVLTKSDEPTTYIKNLREEVPSELANDFDIVFNEDNWVIAVPNTYEAECKLGENTRWCTANAFGNGERFYEQYLSDGGKYYVNFDMTKGESRNGKDYPFTRYQFCFESKQFMDADDRPIELMWIGMPESAKRFYLDEGYSEEDFIDEEGKRTRYEEQRYNYTFNINDELYLCTDYDEDYEFTEPTEQTTFYLFDENDERDPITDIEFPNPHTTEGVVIANETNYVILKTTYPQDTVTIVNREDTSSYREWKAYSFKKYFILPDNLGIFGVAIGSKPYYSYISENGECSYDDGLDADNCENIFINEACTQSDSGKWGRLFIETIAEGYHSLFAIYNSDSDLDCLIMRDVPVNGKSFFINENGMVEGKFRQYNIYIEEDEMQESDHYQLKEELSDGNYVVCAPSKYKYLENIMDRSTRQLILKFGWVEHVIGIHCGLYLVKHREMYAYFNKNGEQIGEWYEVYGIIDEENGILGGSNKKTNPKFQLIDAKSGEIFAEFRDFVGKKPVNGVILVVDDNGFGQGYNYLKRQWAYPQFEYMKQIKYGKYFYCKLRDQEVYAIFDFDKQQVVMNGIVDAAKGNSFGDILVLTKTNGKVTVFGQVDSYRADTNCYQLLPMDVDKVIAIEDITHIIVCVENNKFFVYNYNTKQFMVNPNGTDVPCTIRNGDIDYYQGNAHVCFYSYKVNNSDNFKRWYVETEGGNYGGGSDRIDERTPQEVVNLYNRVIGNYRPSIGEEFKRYMSRINEATKLRYNDVID